MGVLLGLELAMGEQFLPITADEDRVGVHAGMMDTYLILVAAGIVEWFVRKDPQKRWTIAGLLQTLFLTVAGLVVPIAFLTGLLEQLLPIFGLLLLLGLIFFVARIGWRALARNPIRGGVEAWGFFGTFWLVIYVAIFVYFVTSFANPDASVPDWLGTVFVHAGFVGMMTNIILGVDAARTENAAHVLSWGESSARWLINLGMLVFFALKITSDTRLGAIAMGVGVLLGVVTMIQRLRASGGPTAATAEVASSESFG
jgi:energy-coupling factor transporter transmembrane protein EcfT